MNIHLISRSLPGLCVLAAAGAWFVTGSSATAGPSPTPAPAASTAAEPSEDLLGTVEVNGSAEGLPPLPKMAIVPIVTTGTADSLVNLVVRRDMELSGQFEVLDPSRAPSGPFTHTTALELGSWRAQGAEYVLRVYAEPAPNNSIRTQLVGEAYLTPAPAQGAAHAVRAATSPEVPATTPKPAFRGLVTTDTIEIRAASHRLVATCTASAQPMRQPCRPHSDPGARSFTPFLATTTRFGSSLDRVPPPSPSRCQGLFSDSRSAWTTRVWRSL